MIVAVLLAGCSPKSEKPEEVVTQFLNDVKAGKLDEAAQLIDTASQSRALSSAYANADRKAILEAMWTHMAFKVGSAEVNNGGYWSVPVRITTVDFERAVGEGSTSSVLQLIDWMKSAEVPLQERTVNVSVSRREGGQPWRIDMTNKLDDALAGLR